MTKRLPFLGIIGVGAGGLAVRTVNMKLWQQIIEDLALGHYCEAQHHPHAPEERAELFHASDSGSTELEFLNLAHALVGATKPRHVLETGTLAGFGTLALASALKFNGLGRLMTVDVGECGGARELAGRYDLNAYIEFVQSDSVSFCATWEGEPFDFAFFDSDVSVRHRECDLLLRRNKLAPGALAVFHDASVLRHGVPTSWEMMQYLRTLPGGITLNLSRGLRIWQV